MSVCSWHTLCVRSLPAVETMQAYITVAGTAPALNPNRQRDCDNCCSPWRQSPMLNRMLFPSSRPFNTIIWPPFPGLLVLLSLSDIIFFQPSRSYPRGSLDKVTIIAAFLLHHYFDFCDLLGGSSDFRFNSFSLSFLSLSFFLSFHVWPTCLRKGKRSERSAWRNRRLQRLLRRRVVTMRFAFPLIIRYIYRSRKQMANCPRPPPLHTGRNRSHEETSRRDGVRSGQTA